MISFIACFYCIILSTKETQSHCINAKTFKAMIDDVINAMTQSDHGHCVHVLDLGDTTYRLDRQLTDDVGKT